MFNILGAFRVLYHENMATVALIYGAGGGGDKSKKRKHQKTSARGGTEWGGGVQNRWFIRWR